MCFVQLQRKSKNCFSFFRVGTTTTTRCKKWVQKKKCNLELYFERNDFRANGDGDQCDQIWLFLKPLWNKFSYKSSPINLQLFVIFWKTSLLSKNLIWLFYGQRLWKKLGCFLFQLLVKLMMFKWNRSQQPKCFTSFVVYIFRQLNLTTTNVKACPKGFELITSRSWVYSHYH